MKDEDLPTCSLILRSSSMRYKVRAALSSVRGSTNTAGSTKPAGKKQESGRQHRYGGSERHDGGVRDEGSG